MAISLYSSTPSNAHLVQPLQPQVTAPLVQPLQPQVTAPLVQPLQPHVTAPLVQPLQHQVTAPLVQPLCKTQPLVKFSEPLCASQPVVPLVQPACASQPVVPLVQPACASQPVVPLVQPACASQPLHRNQSFRLIRECDDEYAKKACYPRSKSGNCCASGSGCCSGGSGSCCSGGNTGCCSGTTDRFWKKSNSGCCCCANNSCDDNDYYYRPLPYEVPCAVGAQPMLQSQPLVNFQTPLIATAPAATIPAIPLVTQQNQPVDHTSQQSNCAYKPLIKPTDEDAKFESLERYKALETAAGACNVKELIRSNERLNARLAKKLDTDAAKCARLAALKSKLLMNKDYEELNNRDARCCELDFDEEVTVDIEESDDCEYDVARKALLRQTKPKNRLSGNVRKTVSASRSADENLIAV